MPFNGTGNVSLPIPNDVNLTGIGPPPRASGWTAAPLGFQFLLLNAQDIELGT